MRKLFLAYLLPLLLVLCQQGALRHEISHLAGPKQPAETRKVLQAEKLCDACLAFAHLAGAAKPDAPRLPQADHHHALVAVATQGLRSAQALTPRSRGPPTFF